MSQNVTQEFKSFLDKRTSAIPLRSIETVLEMAREGNTVPFMARYRKEKTGNLDEVQIRAVIDNFEAWTELNRRREFILDEIGKQGNLSDELAAQIRAAQQLAELEELYRPYKKKKKTKATLAKEAGIGAFADWIWQVAHAELKDVTSLEVKAKEFINVPKGYVTYEEVLRGAQHIIVEKIANNQDLRRLVKEEYFNHGKVVSKKTAEFKEKSKYDMYAEFSESAKSLQSPKNSHRYLALRRGWQEDELKVTIEADNEKLLKEFMSFAGAGTSGPVAAFMHEAAQHALTIHVIPSITNEVHQLLKESADGHAIHVFAENVRKILMASPLGPKVVLGVDPGLKTGCKLALVENNGHFVTNTVMHILSPEDQAKSKVLIEDVFKKIKIEAVAIGNGTGGREAEGFFRRILTELNLNVPVVLVSESGASVYSASDVAREEFPDIDLTVRGAISIARRLQDPLAELVKVDPKSIGVGQYQHDVAQNLLKKSLNEVVESCVNKVGVDVNTASVSLLQYVSGIGPAIAKNIFNYRKEHGLFQERSDFLKVPQLSTKAYEQAAGFLRVRGGKVPLDQTGIHPERYSVVRDMAKELGSSVQKLMAGDLVKLKAQRERWSKLVGEYTFDDIVRELESPGRDPRDPFKVFQFREDIHELKDLKIGMICPGVVTNVTNFGAFVDIGVHQEGLVHISEMTVEFVEDPRQVVSPGDQVKVRVLNLDLDKSQISLSMILEERPKASPRPEKTAEVRSERRPSKGNRPKKRGAAPHNKGPGSNPGPMKKPGKPFNNPFAALTGLKK